MLAENGIVIKQGPTHVFSSLPAIVDDVGNGLSGMMRQLLGMLYTHLTTIRDQLAELQKMLQALVVEEEAYQRLMQLLGLGVITATLLGSELGNDSAFRNGRSFAAYLGLTPRQHSSGGENVLLGISKRGNRYLRTLLIHGARTALRSILLGRSPFGGGQIEAWATELLNRRGKNKTVVALAGKLVRMAWAILAKGIFFQKAGVAA